MRILHPSHTQQVAHVIHVLSALPVGHRGDCHDSPPWQRRTAGSISAEFIDDTQYSV